ncbi:hypothetical protein C8046_13980 [Serinibacter arcticus]|uniref:Uncharacterized protein n=1 Tax=Serinibacter arcticus TaxID=1655435 RepID=A0A2U1ZX72_9MICO|nr:hypothetical protein [Serinibacter arcticus]PWD51587.1 hypothetical protein C8046_13980 [Serinibacter arcticus]
MTSPLRTALTSRWTWGTAATLAVGVAAIGIGGGWGASPPAELPELAAGATAELGPYDVDVRGWTVSDELLPDDLSYSDAAAWIVIDLGITANPPATVGWFADSLAVEGVEPTGRVLLVDPADGDLIAQVHPGVPTDALLLVPVDAEAAAAADELDRLPVVLSAHVFTAHVISGEEWWWRARPTVTLEVSRDDDVARVGAAS